MNNYGILPANVRYDKELGHGAKLLYVELTAASDVYGIADPDTMSLCDTLMCDRRTLYRYFKQLTDKQYVERLQKGKWRLPQGFTSLSSSSVGEEISEEAVAFYKEFINAFEKGLNCHVERPEYYYPTLAQRLEKFSRNELMRALQNRMAFVNGSEWHQHPDNRPNAIDITLLIRDDISLHKWLNMKTEQTEVKLTPLKFS